MCRGKAKVQFSGVNLVDNVEQAMQGGTGCLGSRVRPAGLSARGCIRYSGVRWVCMGEADCRGE